MKQFLIKLKTILNYNWFIYFILFILLIRPIYYLFNYQKYYPLPKDNKVKIIVKSYKINGNKLTINGRYIYYLKDLEELTNINIGYGYQVTGMGSYQYYQDNKIPNNFNNRYYQNLLGNHYYFKFDNIKAIKTKNVFYQIKNKVTAHLKSYDNYDYYLALLMGDKSYLDSDIEQRYQSNGIAHLLAISGLHLSLFIFTIEFILKKFNITFKYRFLIIILFLLFLLFLTNYPASLLRASLFYFLLQLNKHFKLVDSSSKVLKYVLIILLLIDSHIIFNLGFIYSYLCTYVLVNITYPKNKVLSLLKVSLMTFIATALINILLNNELNIFSIICNLLLVPYMTYLLLPVLLISVIIPYINPFVSLLINLFNKLNYLFDAITIFKVVMPKYHVFFLISYYIILIIYLKLKKGLILLLIILLLIKIMPYFNNSYEIYYLDVGQGDSTLIKYPYQDKVILIDTGGKIKFNNDFTFTKKYQDIDSTIKLIKSLGFKKLDYLIITHGDFDHMGEAINLVESFKVDKVIFNCGGFNELERYLIDILTKKHILYEICIKKLDNLTFLQTQEFANENDNSNVIYTEINGYKFMFMGDAGVTTEKVILNKYNLSDIDVLKVGHHGSKTSSSEEFIEKINPKYSVISVGKNNRYGHPNKAVLKVLDNSIIYRTDHDGSIRFKIRNKNLKIETYGP